MTKLRRILLSVLCTFTLVFGTAHGADAPGMSPMVNLRYVHNLIEHEWGINIPIVSEHPSAPANMRYLFAVIDAANSKVGTKTDYQHSEYATGFAANVNTSIKAVRTLIKPKYHFTATTTADTTTFSFTISASGAFYINWGDGTAMQKVIKPKTGAQTISHTYATAGAYDIRIGGRATGYGEPNGPNTSIAFTGNTNLAKIDGSLGRVFRNVGTNMPQFRQLFENCTNLRGSIPSELFAGVNGAPVARLFDATFDGCSGLTGEIPAGLFAGIKGAPARLMFQGTFNGCSGLTGIGGALFAGVSGAPAFGMFNITFQNCSGLTGPIPAGLFGNISGAPAEYMFAWTFFKCKGLTGEIPDGLFGNISGAPAQYMFQGSFGNCSGLTGGIPVGLFGKLSGAPAPYMFSTTFQSCGGLTGEIPSGLFGDLSGAPAERMFAWTFYGCSGLTGSIPDGLFGNISGAPAQYMFNQTFQGCSGLTGEIPSGLFGNISGSPAAYMFQGTFYDCSGLSGEIPLGLFGNLSGNPAANMFYLTFRYCNKLTGPSARNPDDTPLYTVFPTATTAQVGGMYNGATGLSDYADIPDAWK